jgi:hypothetical protein
MTLQRKHAYLAGVEFVRRRALALICEWMIKNGYATGHGDSVEDLLHQLDWQLQEQIDLAKKTIEQEKAHYRDNEIRWMNIVSKLKESIEQERRKAHKTGYYQGVKRTSTSNLEEACDRAYRAFQAQLEGKE